MVYLGIDVGTGSARAGIFDDTGRMLGSAKQDIRMWKPKADFVQQSSEDIWNAVCQTVRQAMKESGISASSIGGLGFDATCSLVVIDEKQQPVSVSPDGSPEQNIIVWMDHRAEAEAEEINHTGSQVLSYVGGRISPEMQVPKLLWIKRHLPQVWRQAASFFDLPDYLTYRATGNNTRSLCSTVCKMTYLGHNDPSTGKATGWDAGFFRQIGLGDLCDEGFLRLGTCVRPVGEPIPGGLCQAAADAMGLLPGTPVGVSIIDAHAGGLGVLGMPDHKGSSFAFNRRLALIGGTSSCHMAVSEEARFLSGIWGPYFSAMVPGFWLNEGGQSATGSLIDHIIFQHAKSSALKNIAEKEGVSVYVWLNQRISLLARDLPFPAMLAQDLHVCPYFHGNRSPRADSSLRGMISGLTLSSTLDDLARLYLATLDAIAYGTRHILETMNEGGYAIDTLLVCGGGSKNQLFLKEHADITGCRLILPKEPEAVLLGSAILGAVASGAYPSIPVAMSALASPGEVIEPDPQTREFHNRKYRAFHTLYNAQCELRKIMKD